MHTVLRVDNIWKSYSAGVRACSLRIWALRGCTFHLGLGERVAIVGARASGKSTLLRCITGEMRVDAGHVDSLIPIAHRHAAPGLALYPRAPIIHILDECDDLEQGLRFGITAVVASRDVAQVRHIVDRVLLLRDGRLTALTRIAVRRVAEAVPLQNRFRAERSPLE